VKALNIIALSLSFLLLALDAAHARDRDEASELIKRADALYEARRYVDAELLYKRSLAIREKVFGPNHPDVAISLNQLGVLYDTQSRYDDAEQLFKRSLAIREKTLGPNHPDVAESLNALALLYTDQGRHDDAEQLFKRSLAIREKTFGPNDRDVAEACPPSTAG
jgi:tetratricopeptide (TPR) repeat protein